jgi:predicted DNA-binding transcriptional regulator AlpA
MAKKPKQFLRKRGVALRYDVNERTVDRMRTDGRLPPPIYRGRIPLWDQDELDESDRKFALAGRQSGEAA